MKFFESLLTEAQLSDIYVKFYAKDFSEDDYYNIVHADPTFDSARPEKMGKYGKWLLTNAKLGKLKIEDLYKATECLQAFHKYNSRLAVKDITKYKSPDELYDAVKQYINSDEPASNRERKLAGVEHVYEDDEWQVVIPKTHVASVYYGRGTRWCTASKDDDTFFNSYTADGPLYINIRKIDGAKFQFHFPSESFMDAEDKPITGVIYDEISLNDDILEFYENIDESYRDELTKERIDEDEETTVTLLDNERVRVLYDEGAYEISIEYKIDGEDSYTLSTYSGILEDDRTLDRINEPVADVLSPEVIDVIREYLTDDEFFRLTLGLHFIDDIEDHYYPVDQDYVLCHLSTNDEYILYFCDHQSYQCEEIINFKDDDMTVLNEMETRTLMNIKFLKVQDDEGLINAYDIKKEDYVFDRGFKDVHPQRVENLVVGIPEGAGEPIVISKNGEIINVPSPGDRQIVNAEYKEQLDCMIVNCGDDVRNPAQKRTMRLFVYSFGLGEYVNKIPYSNMNNITEIKPGKEIARNVGWAMSDTREKKLDYGRVKWDYTNKDEEKVGEFVTEHGMAMLLNPDSDAPVIMKDKVMSRKEYFESIGAYDVCHKVYTETFG